MFWVFTWTVSPISDKPWTIDEARERLAVTVGDDNIVAQERGFIPPPYTKVRSEAAYLFDLSPMGETAFVHGFVPTVGFYPYLDKILQNVASPAATGDAAPSRAQGIFFGPGPSPQVSAGDDVATRQRTTDDGAASSGPEVPFPPLEALLQSELPGALHLLLRQPKPTAIADLVGHSLRVIHPGEMVTMDYRPNRFNIVLGEDGLIKDTGFY